MIKIGNFLRSPSFLGISLLSFSVGFPPLEDLATISLPAHMLQHTLITLSGFLLGYTLFKHRTFSFTVGKSAHAISLGTITVLIVFWHLPPAWDLAVLSPGVHSIEHLSFLLIGIIAGWVLVAVSDNEKIGMLLLGLCAQLAYALLLVSGVQIYPLYSLQEQNSLGLVMLLAGPFYSTGVLMLLADYRGWFRESPIGLPHASSRVRPPHKRWRTILGAVLSIIMMVSLASYYAISIEAVGTAAKQPFGSVTVYLVETPVSWQYSPQNIKVVIGINNTVTWVSKSISYDTITSDDGLFNSGPIQPGHSFTFAFTQQGEYGYKCIYHPWMTGSVTVLAGTAG